VRLYGDFVVTQLPGGPEGPPYSRPAW